MKRQIISIVLSVIMVLSYFAGMTFSAGASNDDYTGMPIFYYIIRNNGTAEITSFRGSSRYITIPKTVDNYTVTCIGSRAFSECTNLKEVKIPDTVTEIGEYAFMGCTGLTNIIMPESVKSIDYRAFCGCSNLSSVVIPGSVESINGSAFVFCEGLREITVNENNKNYTSVDGVLFDKNMTEIVICPGGYYGSYTIPNGITSIGDHAFYGCTGLDNINIPDSITSISDSAFYGCTGLDSINIPDSITSIGDYAFGGCSNLSSVAVPSSVESINCTSFSHCKGLKEITVVGNNKNYTSIDGVLFDKEMTEIVICPGGYYGNYTIPNGIKRIGDYAFLNCTGLDNINIPDSVINIGKYAFCGCTGLNDINIPDSVTAIGNFAFCRCAGLNNVNISDNIIHIGFAVFSECTGLDNINIPDGVTSIGDAAFERCTGLTNINIPDGVTSIGDAAFERCTGLTNINIPDSVKRIGCWAFKYCENLKSVTIPSSVTYIGAQAFGYTIDKDEICKVPDFTICSYSETEAESFATENGFKFVDINLCEHVEEKITGRSATCIETGLTDGIKCSVCGKVLTEQKKIPALGHSYKDGVCTVCGEIDYKLILKSDSKLILNEEKLLIIAVPEKTNGFTAGEFKSQIDSQVKLDTDDNNAIVNGFKFKFGNYEYTFIIKGDANADGKITASDARTILRIAAKLENPDDVTKESADINSDGKVTSSEARNVLRFAAKLQNKIDG